VNTKEEILRYLKTHGPSSGAALAKQLGISRQAVNKHLRVLVDEGAIVKGGKTRGAVYGIPGGSVSGRKKVQEESRSFNKKYPLEGLEEDRVFDEIALMMNLRRELNAGAFEIFQYALTEIVNNAVDHSGGDECRVIVHIEPYRASFTVRDYGVGIYTRVREAYGLRDEYEALGEFLKGKRSTQPERHSGEGLFFTTKAGDEVTIQSHRIAVTFMNRQQDLQTGEIPFLKGTQVDFIVNKRTRRQLSEIFDRYAPEEFDFQFSRSRVYVKLFQKNYMSRSEARRLTSGLDQFKQIVLDFSGVSSAGQAFCDEIFRVFQKRNPGIEIVAENANPAVEQMIRHAGGQKG
jgi:biotin operon repressor/anti-sigma regulatory factor (Ser/Thr protein kinase)